jgi:pyruvate dehydrogenase E1 component alpha subunit
MDFKIIGKQDLLKPESFYQLLNSEGKLNSFVKTTLLSDKEAVEAFRWMLLQTRFDEKVGQMQRQGRMLTFISNSGEEALQIATAMAMNKKDDYLVPAFRSNLAAIYLGVTIEQQITYWNGQERGSMYNPGVNVLPVNIPIATQCSHAAGIGYALKLLNKKGVAVSFIGDGGTSEGEFYEAMNMAAIHKWNTVFCINNNQWSISTPRKFQSISPTYASKAIGFGIPAIRVDGNDLFASYEAMKEALEHARSGKGPVLVEFLTYRKGPHSSADNPKLYRTEDYEKEQIKKDPVIRMRTYLTTKKLWNEKMEQEWAEKCDKEIMDAYNSSVKTINSTLDEVFDYTYATLTDELREQKAEAQALVDKKIIKSDY